MLALAHPLRLNRSTNTQKSWKTSEKLHAGYAAFSSLNATGIFFDDY